jgi:electron-transferring-flavoprotein dehydrogenase
MHECYNAARLAREPLQFDVVIVGAGPAGLSAACRLGQLSRQLDLGLSIAVVDKGASVGAHIVSGAIVDTRALDELFPDWQERGAPLGPAVVSETLRWLAGPKRQLTIPHWLVPQSLRNQGCRIASLGRLCRWLAGEAEALGCDVLTGFAAQQLLYDAAGRVRGVATGAFGLAADGSETAATEPGQEIAARYVLLAEGSRGHLGQEVERRFALREGRLPQRYSLGFKEVWSVPGERVRPGHVEHSFGWPLGSPADGGGFVYHAGEGRLYVGLVVALDYRNPWRSPFGEFQRFKQHPAVRRLLEGGSCIGFGARAISRGGLRSLPKLCFPGGLLIGCDAGFLNPARLKGTHAAMKSGMLAAESVARALAARDPGNGELADYAEAFHASWLHAELRTPGRLGKMMAKSGGCPDHAALAPVSRSRRIVYPEPDGEISFDRLSSIHRANIDYREGQPGHLVLADPDLPVRDNLPRFGEPAQRYCPAAVYEIVDGADRRPALRINAGNCIHCKACEIKDPAQNIRWLPPEGGSGPNYADL